MTGSFQKIKRFWPELVVCLLLAFAVHAIYIQAITFGFVGVEDEILYSEPRSRLDAGGTPLLECFRMTSNTLYWVPVSNLVLFTDVWLCGDNIGMLHLMNVSTHAANTVLLFLVLRIATACIRRSAFVAALLGLHPMNTESVVCWSWGATQVEAFMTMVTFLFYFNYARKPTVKKFVPVILCFILCLLSRPSILYLPVLLLLFDYWPLGRWRQKNTGKRDNRFAMSSPGKLIAEKIPLLMISALYLAVIFFVLRLTPAVPSVRTLLPESSLYLLNLPIAYVLFLWTFFFPFYLPYFFPDPMTPPFMMPLWQVILASIGLIFTSLAVVKKGNKYPFLITGWIWFLVALFPSAMACVSNQKIIMTRLGYLPMIGIFIIISWGGAYLLKKRVMSEKPLMVLSVSILLFLSMVSCLQARHWSDRINYFRHAVETYPDSEKTHSVLGEVLYKAGRIDEAIAQYKTALQINPNYAVAHNHMALIFSDRGDRTKALDHLQQAVQLNPGYVEAHNNLANLLADLNDFDGAIMHYNEALRINPTLFQTHNNLATALLNKGEYDRAVSHFKQSLAINPGYKTARDNLIKAQQMRRTP